MTLDEKLAELEKCARALENEKSFDKAMSNFESAAKLVADLVSQLDEKKGKVSEIIRSVNGLVEGKYVENPDD